ncbi:hypothetical protein H4R33_001581 [Dimargaris cristalligena]|nr:hypothetical protein H4R33_001581 [Dimargaris cristalligena]
MTHFLESIAEYADLWSDGLRPVLAGLNLEKLTYHWPVVLASTLACSLIFTLSGILSPMLFPASFRNMKAFQRINWNIHVVSMVHCCLALYWSFPLINHPKLADDYINSYWPYFSNIAAVSCGYFLWDFVVSMRYIKQTGIGFAVHGLGSFAVFLLSFRPFINAYGPVFLMLELSTPFLNLHWFMDKLGMTGSLPQLVNGVILLATFFGSRLVFGIYWAIHLYTNFYHNWDTVPHYLAISVVVSNMALNILNFFWFSKMVSAIRGRFDQPVEKDIKMD